MTNREWLNSLNDYDFALEVFIITSEIQKDSFSVSLDIFDFTFDCTLCLDDWLKQERKEELND